jgi:urease accessory protein
MIVQKIIGALSTTDTTNREVDLLHIEWHETGKKILHKKTAAGRDIALKLINEPKSLGQDDIVFADEQLLVAIDIKVCPVLLIRPQSMYEMAAVVYEIGNKHLPLYYEEGQLLVPFEQPLFNVLRAAGYKPVQAERKLLNALKTTVLPHGGKSNNTSLFSRIMQLTANDR